MTRQVNKCGQVSLIGLSGYNPNSWLFRMKHEIPIRITIIDPLPGVSMKVQKGKHDLLAATAVEGNKISFSFDIKVDLSGAVPNFLPPFGQGPKDSRFIYVNSGSYSGQEGTLWARRAKLSLMSITKEQVESVLASPGARFSAEINGVGRDGGPVCASVKNVEWKITS